mmetsp:Transcript_34846/g.87661  ORF Transcript_34846/g.87661 Transcript_34846/m.87661 type:complete len:491 (-) Transcript_34846:97-1569(-)|eukprot:CAMPEP_0177629198 /NCGR_PEP_ID=MMETSP0447-20121125/542_1 /TAXON_ID=0 /ORGANISM="Stygamoeba regulata, Strain BSH-02190019" /LENGTH=490 /DNA_ID=CAMNT_0019130507 /DNA_START=36 /DNA_END=1508 /DNA_ORIENTATION=-
MANIWQAAKDGDLSRVTVLLDRGHDVNQGDTIGFTPLHWAAQRGHLDMAAHLFKSGADLNVQDADGQTPLHWAVDKKYIDMIHYLVEHGADVNAVDGYKHTALHRAAAGDLANIAELLIKHGADVSLQNEKGFAPLHLACFYRFVDVVKVIVAHQTEIDLPNCDGWSTLYYAAKMGFSEMIPILLQAGANVNQQSNDRRTALHEAVSENHADVVRILLGAKARTDLKDKDDKTAVDLASKDTLDALQATTCIDNCTAIGNGLRYCQPGEKSDILLTAKDHLHRPVKYGGDEWSASIVLKPTEDHESKHRSSSSKRKKTSRGKKSSKNSKRRAAASTVTINPNVTDLKNGTYRIEYTIPEAGSYELNIFLLTTPLPGSPFLIRCSTNVPLSEPNTGTTGCPRPEVSTDEPPSTRKELLAAIHTQEAELDSLSSMTSTELVKCRLCTVAQLDTVLFPCLHLCCCQSCANNLYNCPLCDSSIKGSLRANTLYM